jgi:hypothetical protein
MFIAACIQILGAALQGGAVNVGMFIVGRFFIGCGMGFSAVAAPTYVAEVRTIHSVTKAFANILLVDFPPKVESFHTGNVLHMLGCRNTPRCWCLLWCKLTFRYSYAVINSLIDTNH